MRGDGWSAVPRRLGRIGLVVAVATLLSGCFGTWGIKQSYRSYVAGPIGDGEITVADGALWNAGPPPGQGPFRFDVEWATFNESTETGAVQMRGRVETAAHAAPGGGWVLESSWSNPRLQINGDVGTLIVDLNYRPYAGTNPPAVPALQAALDVPFATVDLSGEDLSKQPDGWRKITAAPMIGIPAAMELIGWDEFYPGTVVLDPLDLSFDEALYAPALAASPSIVVSETEGLRAGDTITVWGRGFNPSGNTGTRPPLSGQPAGNYVIFGKFLDTWQPSAGAPGTSRTVISQKWALPQPSFSVLNPTGTNPSYVRIDEFGRWEATVTVGTSPNAGNYGVYTFPGSGAVNAAHEFFVAATFAP